MGSYREYCRIRPATVSDAGALRPLLSQLGYDLDVTEIASRIARVSASDQHYLVVAEGATGSLLALLHVYGRPAVEKPPEAIVQALVVRDDLRGKGLGRKMMDLAEAWATDKGYPHISLGSQQSRDGAHAFYERLGYARYATSHQFRKSLA